MVVVVIIVSPTESPTTATGTATLIDRSRVWGGRGVMLGLHPAGKKDGKKE